MTEFVNIEDVLDLHKGNFKGSCISQSDLKAGSGASGDWTRKIFTLEDRTGKIEMTAWNEEIQFFKVGQFYEVENPWWKEYEGKWSCNLGKYCKIKAVNPPTTPTVKEAIEIANEASEEIEPEPVNNQEIPKATAYLLGFVDEETIKLLQIRDAVKERMLLHQPHISQINGAELGGYTLEIYRQYKLEGNKV